MHCIYEVLPLLLKISYSRRENFLLVGRQVVALGVLLWGRWCLLASCGVFGGKEITDVLRTER